MYVLHGWARPARSPWADDDRISGRFNRAHLSDWEYQSWKSPPIGRHINRVQFVRHKIYADKRLLC